MFEPGPAGPIVMVNLLKFRDRAVYEDGRPCDLTGREAYALYGARVGPMITAYGGRVLFVGDVTWLAIGEVDRLWDEVALAQYPDRAALTAMSTSAEWRAISVHRAAGLEGQLNIETVMPAWLVAAQGA
ncbi:MAG: DUF1330 domain-containing protein [Brevundimonas sp.]|jgi:uncharacterized protein (DUF1330 family)